MPKTTRGVLQRADQTLHTAKLGLRLLGATHPQDRMAGLMNVATFGRAVTNVLENLRGVEPDFDGWYRKRMEKVKADPLMKFFYQLRSRILKQGVFQVTSDITLNADGRAIHEIMNRSPKPPGATGFVVGDPIGGSGWTIEYPDGTTETFYVTIPADEPGFNMTSQLYFSDVPEEFRNSTIDELCARYVTEMESIVEDAKRVFLNDRQ